MVASCMGTSGEGFAVEKILGEDVCELSRHEKTRGKVYRRTTLPKKLENNPLHRSPSTAAASASRFCDEYLAGAASYRFFASSSAERTEDPPDGLPPGEVVGDEPFPAAARRVLCLRHLSRLHEKASSGNLCSSSKYRDTSFTVKGLISRHCDWSSTTDSL